MKWKWKGLFYEPPIGTTRIIRFFTIVPISVGDDWRWLEWVTILQRWSAGDSPYGAHWEYIKFISASATEKRACSQ